MAKGLLEIALLVSGKGEPAKQLGEDRTPGVREPARLTALKAAGEGNEKMDFS